MSMTLATSTDMATTVTMTSVRLGYIRFLLNNILNHYLLNIRNVNID